MKLLITIDTEEDNWARYSTTTNSVENIERLVGLQKIFDTFGVRPTYLVSYPVATDPRAVARLRQVLAGGRGEIGAHCHPWNTPPFEEEISSRTSMLCNLPEELQYRKLALLHEVICRNFDCTPVSFRAGRWGFSAGVARSLCRLGYRVDTSVTPYESWEIYHGPDFSAFDPRPFRFSPAALAPAEKGGEMLQVPATVGFLQEDFVACRERMRAVESGIGRKLHLKGILGRLRLLNKVWLSPEMADAPGMIALARRMKKKGFPCLNMSFHTTSLVAGLSPFVREKAEEAIFLRRIEEFLAFAVAAGMEPVTLAEYEAGA